MFLQHDLQGHISDVNTCKFFPSGKVVLSGGADLRLKIWSAEDGSCPVTLKGHTAGIKWLNPLVILFYSVRGYPVSRVTFDRKIEGNFSH